MRTGTTTGLRPRPKGHAPLTESYTVTTLCAVCRLRPPTGFDARLGESVCDDCARLRTDGGNAGSTAGPSAMDGSPRHHVVCHDCEFEVVLRHQGIAEYGVEWHHDETGHDVEVGTLVPDGGTEDGPTGTVVLVDEHGYPLTWHHSVEFDGYRHTTACGLDVHCDYIRDVLMDDPADAWRENVAPRDGCSTCHRSVYGQSGELVTDGGTSVYDCDTPGCTGEKEVITPDGYVCRDCGDALAEEYEEVEQR